MTAIAENILKEALQLEPEERERIAQALLRPVPGDEGCHAEWLQLSEQRRENVRMGISRLVPAEEAFERLERAAEKTR
jgi:hypothetical protein